MRKQEPLLKHYLDLLIRRLKENSTKPVDVSFWFNAVTFDVVGDLTLGESFGCLEKGELHVCFALFLPPISYDEAEKGPISH